MNWFLLFICSLIYKPIDKRIDKLIGMLFCKIAILTKPVVEKFAL